MGTTNRFAIHLVMSWLLTAMAAVGCGGSSASSGNADGATDGASTGDVVSCTVSQSDGTRTYNVICIEATPALRLTVQSACNAPDAGPPAGGVNNVGRFAQTPCTHDGAVGGCRTTFGGNSQTSWYYPGAAGITVAQIQQLCAGIGATFVAP